MLMVFQFFQSFGYYGFAAWVPTLIARQVGIDLGASLLSLRRAGHPVQQRTVLCLSLLSDRAVPDAHPCPGRRIHLLVQPHQHRVMLSIGIFGPPTRALELEEISH